MGSHLQSKRKHNKLHKITRLTTLRKHGLKAKESKGKFIQEYEVG